MHTIHHTEAIVLKSTSHGEANKRLWLFTREFGLVVAAMQGVRKPGAKLASHSSDYSIIRADLVKGREVWRLISAKVAHNPLEGRMRDPMARAYVRTLSAMSRFLVDEGVHEELYDHVLVCAAMLEEGVAEAKVFDALSLWRVLAHLGYIAVGEGDELLFTLPLREAYASVSAAQHARLMESVKSAIQQSHL